MVDDGTLPGRRGSLTVDDEGTPTQRTVLIEDGVLRGYMQDSLNARLMKMPLTGNGAARVLRAPHAAAHDQHLHARGQRTTRRRSSTSVKKGLYAINFGGGQVDITNGKFVFSAAEAYLIENGKVTLPGEGRDADRQRPRCAHARQHDRQRPRSSTAGIGTCGKEGQSVPVGVGQPTLKIDGLTVGGTA